MQTHILKIFYIAYLFINVRIIFTYYITIRMRPITYIENQKTKENV